MMPPRPTAQGPEYGNAEAARQGYGSGKKGWLQGEGDGEGGKRGGKGSEGSKGERVFFSGSPGKSKLGKGVQPGGTEPFAREEEGSHGFFEGSSKASEGHHGFFGGNDEIGGAHHGIFGESSEINEGHHDGFGNSNEGASKPVLFGKSGETPSGGNTLSTEHSPPMFEAAMGNGIPVKRDTRSATGNYTHEERSQAVIEAFRHAWTGYSNHCFGKDSFHPVSKSCENNRNGWGVTAVDALSTAILMNETLIVGQILKHVASIDFSSSADGSTTNIFESTIRYMGGLMSAYDLLRGPLANTSMALDTALVSSLLEQTERLANVLTPAFDSPSGIPCTAFRWGSDPAGCVANGQSITLVADAGSLILEWTHLSDLTNNPKYARLAERVEGHLLQPKPASAEPFPGLVGSQLDIETGEFVNNEGGWGGGSDCESQYSRILEHLLLMFAAFYEYLLKLWFYDPHRNRRYLHRWLEAANSITRYLSSSPYNRPDLTFLSGFSGEKPKPHSSHLAAFAAGNFIQAGLHLHNQNLLKFGTRLATSTYHFSRLPRTKILPESFTWNSCPPTPLETTQQSLHTTNPSYNLRPELLESLYHASIASSARNDSAATVRVAEMA